MRTGPAVFHGGVLLLCLALLSTHCAATRKAEPREQGQAVATDAHNDTRKAHLALKEIEPRPAKPQAPASLAPLSARASRQIAEADRLIAQQRYTEAAIELERALRYDPNHPQIHRALAELHWEAGNLERAKTHVAKALEGNPDDAVAHYIDGRCKLMDGYNASAMSAFRTALLCSNFEDDENVAALCHYHLAKVLDHEGYWQAALGQYQAFETRAKRLEDQVSNPELADLIKADGRAVALARATLLEKLGRFSSAADALAPFAHKGKAPPELSLRYTRLLVRANRTDEALSVAQSIRSDDPQVLEALYDIYEELGQTDKIIDDLNRRLAEKPDQPRLVLSLADMLLRLGKPHDAVRTLEEYLSQYGDKQTVRKRLADVYIGQGEWDKALQVCADGAAQDPSHAPEYEATIASLADKGNALERLIAVPVSGESPSASWLRGRLALAAGRLDAAERFLKHAYARQPDSIAVREALARVYWRTYRYDEALAVADQSHQGPEDPRLERVLGDIYERLDDVEQAEAHYKAAIQLDRSNAEAMLALARLYDASGRRLQAQRQLQVLLDREPDHDEARELLAVTYFEDGKPDVAVEQYEELARRTGNPLTQARCSAVIEQVRSGNADGRERFRRTLMEALKQYGPEAKTWLAVAEAYDPWEEAQQQAEAYREALALDPDEEKAALGLVSALQRQLAFEQAAQKLEELLPRRPNRHAWRLGLIDLMWTLQEYDHAMALAQEMAARDDLDDVWRRRYRAAIVDTLRMAGRSDEALAKLRNWVEEEPEDQEWSELLAREYLRQDMPKKAAEIFERIYESESEGHEAIVPLLQALSAADQYDRAAQYLLDWLERDPGNDGAILRLGEVLRRAGHFEDALELARNRLLHTFAREEYQDLQIRVLIQAKAFDRCIDLIEGLLDELHALMTRRDDEQPAEEHEKPTAERLIRLPSEPFTLDGLHRRLTTLRLGLGGALMLAEDYRAAVEKLTTWLDALRNPAERFNYLTQLAFCYRRQGNEQQATEYLARALLIRPREVSLNNDVAYGWIDRGVRLDDAERMIRYAVAKSPRQAAYLDTLGWLRYKQGDLQAAKRWLLRAAGADQDVDPVILDHLGDTLWRLGEKDAAVDRWSAAVEAARNRKSDQPRSADERRVEEVTPRKTEDAMAGRVPTIAPLAAEQTPQAGEVSVPED